MPDVATFFNTATQAPSFLTLYQIVCVNELLFLLILTVTVSPIVSPVTRPKVDFLLICGTVIVLEAVQLTVLV